MTMTFDDLDDRQKGFLEKYLPKVGFFGKKKTEGKRDRIAQDFDGYERRRDTTRRGIDRLPDGANKFLLHKLVDEADAKMKGDGKTLDIAAGHAALDGVDIAIANEGERLKKLATPKPLQDQKADAARDIDTALRVERQKRAEDLIVAARKDLRFRDPKHQAQVDPVVADLDKAFKTAQTALIDHVKLAVPDPKIDLTAFTTTGRGFVTTFATAVDDAAKKLEALKAPPKAGPKEMSEFYQANRTDPDVARFEQRALEVEKEIPKLEKAIKALTDKIADLKQKRKDEPDLGEKKALEAQYTAVDLQKKALADRLARLKQYEKDEVGRFREMLLANEKLDALWGIGEGMAKANGDTTSPAFDGLRALTEAEGFRSFDPGELAKVIETRRADYERSAARVIRGDRLYPDEPELTEINQRELAVLLGLLKTAETLLGKKTEEGNALATAAVEDARRLWVEFVAARKTTLPPVPDTPASQETVLANRLDRLAAPILDLRAQGSDKADGIDRDVATARNDVAAEGQKPAPDWQALEKRVAALEQRVADAEAALPPVKPSAATKKAGETANNVATALLDLYNTKPITDPSKIEVPGKDWGPEGPPEDMIPADLVITVVNPKTGKEEHHQILTRVQGGRELERREDKGVPREMMQQLMNRNLTLQLMAQNAVDGMEGDIAAYADETQKLLDSVTSKAGHEAYKTIEKTVKEISDLLAKGVLTEFIPNDLVNAKKKFEEFKKAYVKMLPSEALQAATEQETAFKKLKEAAEDLEKQYQKVKGTLTTIAWDLNSTFDRLMGESAEVGTQMGDLMTGGAAKLAAKVKDLDPAVLKQITDAEATMKEQVAKKRAKADSLEGAWRGELDKAWRMIRAKSKEALDEGEAAAVKLSKEIADMQKTIGELSSLSGDDLKKALTALAPKLLDNANGAKTNADTLDAWEANKKSAKEKLKAVDKSLKKDMANYETLHDRYLALKAQVDSVKAEVKTSGDRTWGNRQFADIVKALGELEAEVKGDGRIGKANPDAVIVLERVVAVKNRIDQLAAVAAEIEKKIRAAADPQELVTMTAQVDAVKTSLEKLASLKTHKSLAALDTLAREMDGKKDDPKDTAALKRGRREQALAEVRALQTAIETHPAVAKVYRNNPFDGGQLYPLVMGTLRRLEIGVLVSVDPRAE